MAQCNKQFTQEGTGANEKEAVGDMLLKAEAACPNDCKCVKLVSMIHVFRETPVVLPPSLSAKNVRDGAKVAEKAITSMEGTSTKRNNGVAQHLSRYAEHF